MNFATFSISILLAGYVFLGVTSCDQVSPERATTVEPRCEARWYDDQSDESRCYGLQKRLTASVVGGDLVGVKESINRGANVNGGFDQSIPVLEAAASAGTGDIIQVLIEAGANINRVRPLGQTALKVAVIHQHIEPTRLLIEKGADVCESTESSAWNYAVEAGNADMIAILERAGAKQCSQE